MYNLKPFIKWAGGKTQLLDELKSRIPQDKTEYVEPFVGGGALFLDQLDNLKYEKYTINDLNRKIYNLYSILADEDKLQKLALTLSLLEGNYLSMTAEKQKQFFLDVRNEFNTITTSDAVNTAQFIFLNKSCFNGLYRVNKKGEFNTPWGGEKKGMSINYRAMNDFNFICSWRNVEITNTDYQECLKHITENSFVYLDPPYRPLGGTSSFTSYTANGFDDDEQKKLKLFCDEINNIGAKFMLSNSDCPDGFFDELYKDYKIERVYARRNINSDGAKRGKISELLIRNY